MVLSASQARLAQLLERYVTQVTPELFRVYGVELERVASPDTSDRGYTIAGIVGFVGQASGMVLLGTSPALVEACHPLRDQGGPVHEHLVLDWVGELANQLIGRLELRLAKHGVVIRFSSPISLAGDRMRHVMARGTTCRAAYTWGAEPVSVWIDADLTDEFLEDIEAFHQDQEDPAVEGQVVLF